MSSSSSFDLEVFLLHLVSHLIENRVVEKQLASLTSKGSGGIGRHTQKTRRTTLYWRSPLLGVSDGFDAVNDDSSARHAAGLHGEEETFLFLDLTFEFVPHGREGSMVRMYAGCLRRLLDEHDRGKGRYLRQVDPWTLRDLELHLDPIGVIVEECEDTGALAKTMAEALLHGLRGPPKSSGNNARNNESCGGKKVALASLEYKDMGVSPLCVLGSNIRKSDIEPDVLRMLLFNCTQQQSNTPNNATQHTVAAMTSPGNKAASSCDDNNNKNLENILHEWRKQCRRRAAAATPDRPNASHHAVSSTPLHESPTDSSNTASNKAPSNDAANVSRAMMDPDKTAAASEKNHGASPLERQADPALSKREDDFSPPAPPKDNQERKRDALKQTQQQQSSSAATTPKKRTATYIPKKTHGLCIIKDRRKKKRK